jgi:hypothetical protein
MKAIIDTAAEKLARVATIFGYASMMFIALMMLLFMWNRIGATTEGTPPDRDDRMEDIRMAHAGVETTTELASCVR